MRYDITTCIRYLYKSPAATSRHVVRLVPADLPGEQRLVAGSLTIDPEPSERTHRLDYFGNALDEIAFREPQREIAFTVHSRVEVFDRGHQLDVSPILAELPAELAAYRRLDARAPHHFLGPSRRVPADPRVATYARTATSGAASVLDAVIAIGRAIHRDFRFAAGATTVDTSVAEAFAARHGVCQDFSHIMICALRSLNVPAAYVSGFLRTLPPPGRQRLEGADAMHAWVAAWCGNELGWIEYDPTNATLSGTDHIVVGRGRDYADVAPVRGIMRTSGPHTSVQAVDVVPVP